MTTMPFIGSLRTLLFTLMLLGMGGASRGQTFPFTSGPIPLCDTSTFTANVSGVGTLITPDGWNWGPYIDNVVLNITTDHPQTLQISLTSPQGTTLLLSAFNGAGGQNYTNTLFPYWGGSNITAASAPFTGFYNPQGGSLSVFDWENADGVWTITVIDTACASSGPGPGGGWTPGWFNGASSGSGGFAFGFSSPPPPCVIDMGNPITTICAGGSVDILSDFETTWGGMGVTFTAWDLWTGAFVTDPYNVTTAGAYQVEGSDWGNCWYMGTYTVQISTGIDLGPDQSVEQCSGAGPVDLTALFDFTGATSSSWTLDGGPISSPMAATATGVYEVTATNGGCSEVAQVTLAIASDPVLGGDQSVSLCAGGTVDLTALFATVGLSPTWTFNGAPYTTPGAAADAGVYTIDVVSVDGCTDMAQVTVTVDAPPVLGADQTHALCNNSSLDLTVLYNTAGLSASWTYLAAPVVTPTAAHQGGTYQLVAATAAGCTDTALVVVDLNVSPVLGGDLIDSVCEDQAVDLTGFYPTTGLSTTWTFGGVPVPDPTVVTTPGVYTLVATDANNCSDTAQTTVVVMPVPVLGPDQVLTRCAGTAVDLTSLYVIGVNTAEWTLAGTPVANPEAVTAAGNYMLVATSADGCAASAMVTLQLDPSPALGADQSAGTCAGTSIDLTSFHSTTGLVAEWTLAGAPVVDPTAVSTSGNYQLVVTNGFNCTDTAVVSYTVFANPNLGADQVFSICPWQSVDLTAVFPVSGMSATYTLDGFAVSDPTQVVDAGTYVISVVDANGCTALATATVLPIECLCVADFVEDARCMQEPVQFTLLADSTVLAAYWDFHGAGMNATGTQPEVRFLRPGELLVTVHASLSCGEVAVERIIHVPDCSDSCTVYIPSAFSPDGDGINDRWNWGGECPPEDFSMIVFDRWGEVVFESEDPWRAWDGTAGGKEVPSGVYVYRAAYKLLYQEHKEVSGSITLIR